MKRLLLLSLYLLLSIYLLGQNLQRPKVGLVLSGGSAHGLSHIGVIKYLEDQGIPIDYVTGTSMGSIVGGLYAMGFSAAQIEAIAKDVDWQEVLSGSTYLNEVAPSEKRLHNKFALNFLIKDGEISLPSGFINSQKLDLLISRLYSGAHFINDFNDLPRPFRCMAVDIVDGEVVDFKSGNLSRAIRASMAIPSVFSPVDIDGRLYVDGGLIRNMPAWENIEMGADILIGVYVGGVLEPREELTSLLDILNQSAFMMGVLDSREQKELVDVLIEPDVKDEPSFAFERVDHFVQEGYTAALRMEDQIEAIKYRLGRYGDKQNVDKVRNPDALKLARINFPSTPSPYDKLAKFKFGPIRSKSYRVTGIEKAIDRIYGTKHFENISYELLDGKNGYKDMVITARPKKVTDLNANLSYFPTSGAALILNSELRNILADLSVLNINVRLAQNFAGGLEYFYRLGKKKDFILMTLSELNKYDQFLYQGSDLRFKYSAIDLKSKLGVAYEPNNKIWTGFTSGIELNHIKPQGSLDNGLGSFEQLNWVSDFFAAYNSLDRSGLANRGLRLTFNLAFKNSLRQDSDIGLDAIEVIPEADNYVMSGVGFDVYYPVLEKVNLSLNMNAGWKSNNTFLDNFRVGGLETREYISIPFFGLNTDQIQFSKILHLRGNLRFELLNRTYLSLTVDRGVGDLTFQVKEDPLLNQTPTFWGYGLSFTRDSAIGPISLAYGKNTLTDNWNTNFTIGYTFF